MNKPHSSARWGILLIASLALAGILACQSGGGQPPTAEITYPATGGQVAVGTSVPIHSVSRDDQGISRVELWASGQLEETTTASGTERTYVAVQHWMPSEVGVFNIGVQAYDPGGQVSEPAVIAIQVVATAAEVTEPLPEPPTQPPTQPPPGPEEATATPLTAVEAPTPQTAIITPLGADLETGNCGYPPPARVGEPVAFGLIIWNSGDDYARDFRWGIQPISPAMEYMPSSEYIVLGPNEDRWFDWQGPPIVYDEPGQYTALVLVDVDGVVGEQDENNNQCLIEVTVEGAEAPAPTPVSWQGSTVFADAGRSGHLSVGLGGAHMVNPSVEVGDDVGNSQRMGFLTFDLSQIPQGATIHAATLNLGSFQSDGAPFQDLGGLSAYHVNYGELDGDDWDLQAEAGRPAYYGTRAELSQDVNVLTSFQRAWRNGWDYQLRLVFDQAANSDGRIDSLEFNIGGGGVRLVISYSE